MLLMNQDPSFTPTSPSNIDDDQLDHDQGGGQRGRRVPPQKRGRSRQDWATPPNFLTAVKKRLLIGEFTFDLAASPSNRVCEGFFSIEDDSLSKDWAALGKGWLWLNPPFGDIGPWVRKAREEARKGASIAVLVPASVGSNWWRDYVHQNMCDVYFLNGRITFVGAPDPYPKDLALLLYHHARDWCTDCGSGKIDVWSWAKDLKGSEGV